MQFVWSQGLAIGEKEPSRSCSVRFHRDFHASIHKEQNLNKQRLTVILISGLLLSSANAFAKCYGYAGPGGPCYSGPGGPEYSGPGGGGGVSPICR